MKRNGILDKVMPNLVGKKVIRIWPESLDRDDFTIFFNDRSEIYVDILQAKINNPPKKEIVKR